MAVDPKTGLVAQGYRNVTKEQLDAFVEAYPRASLREASDDTIGVDGWEDVTLGAYPEGLVAFTRRMNGHHFIREADSEQEKAATGG